MGGLTAQVPHVWAGRLRALGVTGTQRASVLPDVPTIAEAGRPSYAFLRLDRCRRAGGNAAAGHRPTVHTDHADFGEQRGTRVDGRCEHLLGNCSRALPPGARLLVLERIVPDRLDLSEHDLSICRSDLNMLSALSGRERRESEFQSLLAQAGLMAASVTATAGEFSLIDAVADELASKPQPDRVSLCPFKS